VRREKIISIPPGAILLEVKVQPFTVSFPVLIAIAVFDEVVSKLSRFITKLLSANRLLNTLYKQEKTQIST